MSTENIKAIGIYLAGMGTDLERIILLNAIKIVSDSATLNSAVSEARQVKNWDTRESSKLTALQAAVKADEKGLEKLEQVFEGSGQVKGDVTINSARFEVQAARINAILITKPNHASTNKILQTALDKQGIKLNALQKIAFAGLFFNSLTNANLVLNGSGVDGQPKGIVSKLLDEQNNLMDPKSQQVKPEDLAKYTHSTQIMEHIQLNADQIVQDALMNTFYDAIERLKPGEKIFVGETCEFSEAFKASLAQEMNKPIVALESSSQKNQKLGNWSMAIGAAIILLIVVLEELVARELVILPLVGAPLVAVAIGAGVIGTMLILIVASYFFNNSKESREQAIELTRQLGNAQTQPVASHTDSSAMLQGMGAQAHPDQVKDALSAADSMDAEVADNTGLDHIDSSLLAGETAAAATAEDSHSIESDNVDEPLLAAEKTMPETKSTRPDSPPWTASGTEAEPQRSSFEHQ